MNKLEFERRIKMIIGNTNGLLISEAKSKETLPIYKFNDKSIYENNRYAVKLFEKKGVFIVWDLEIRRKNNLLGISVRLKNSSWDNISIGIDEIDVQYKEIGNRGSGIWEKIYVVGLNHIDQLFEHLDEYMKFNKHDKNVPKEIKIESSECEAESREKYSSERWKRDIKFRNAVLDAYDHKCAVCRCDVEEILQAAHEHGYEPDKTISDDPKHGICLCANHHLMYDRGLIDISINQKTISILDERVKKMSWFKEFNNEYNGCLLQQIYS